MNSLFETIKIYFKKKLLKLHVYIYIPKLILRKKFVTQSRLTLKKLNALIIGFL